MNGITVTQIQASDIKLCKAWDELLLRKALRRT